MLQRVEMVGGSLTFVGVVSVMGSSLVEVVFTGSSGSALSLSGGTITGSTIAMTSGGVMVDTGCVLADSPIDVGGADGVVTITGAELQSDRSSVPLTVNAGGTATVTATTFRSTAGDITAVSVSEGGSLTVGGSRLVGMDGSADPLPCNGVLPECAGEHDGSVVVEGMAAATLASPLVCDVATGECLADVCLGRGDVCAEDGPAWIAGSTCVDAVCVCTSTDGLASESSRCSRSNMAGQPWVSRAAVNADFGMRPGVVVGLGCTFRADPAAVPFRSDCLVSLVEQGVEIWEFPG